MLGFFPVSHDDVCILLHVGHPLSAVKFISSMDWPMFANDVRDIDLRQLDVPGM